MPRNKHRRVFTEIQLVVLMKILCYSCFASSNLHTDMKSLNENHAANDYHLGFVIKI